MANTTMRIGMEEYKGVFIEEECAYQGCEMLGTRALKFYISSNNGGTWTNLRDAPVPLCHYHYNIYATDNAYKLINTKRCMFSHAT